MNRLKKLKHELKKQGNKAVMLKRMIDEGTKLRFTCSDMDIKIMAKLTEKSNWITYSPNKQTLIRDIVREECFKQEQYKAKELVGLARRIEKRLTKETKQFKISPSEHSKSWVKLNMKKKEQDKNDNT